MFTPLAVLCEVCIGNAETVTETVFLRQRVVRGFVLDGKFHHAGEHCESCCPNVGVDVALEAIAAFELDIEVFFNLDVITEFLPCGGPVQTGSGNGQQDGRKRLLPE